MRWGQKGRTAGMANPKTKNFFSLVPLDSERFPPVELKLLKLYALPSPPAALR